jgi:hypothetical protein
MSLCKYKNIFGEPNTGLHTIRILNIAVIDVLLTIILGILIHQFIIVKWLNLNNNISLFIVLVVLFVLGIILHRLFCVKTKVDKMIFGE